MRATLASPNGSFDKLVNDWLPNHRDSTGSIAILQFNHPADCKKQCIPKEYDQDDFGSQASWVATMDQYSAPSSRRRGLRSQRI